MSFLVAPAIAIRLVLAGVSRSTVYTNNHVYIALMNIVYVGKIDEILIPPTHSLAFSIVTIAKKTRTLTPVAPCNVCLVSPPSILYVLVDIRVASPLQAESSQ